MGDLVQILLFFVWVWILFTSGYHSLRYLGLMAIGMYCFNLTFFVDITLLHEVVEKYFFNVHSSKDVRNLFEMFLQALRDALELHPDAKRWLVWVWEWYSDRIQNVKEALRGPDKP